MSECGAGKSCRRCGVLEHFGTDPALKEFQKSLVKSEANHDGAVWPAEGESAALMWPFTPMYSARFINGPSRHTSDAAYRESANAISITLEPTCPVAKSRFPLLVRKGAESSDMTNDAVELV